MEPKTSETPKIPSLSSTFAAFFGHMDEIEAEVRAEGISDTAYLKRHPITTSNTADTTEEAARNR